MISTAPRPSRLSFLARRLSVLFSCVLVNTVAIGGHDLWIEPSAFILDPGKPIAIRLRVGADLLGDPVARDPALIERFIAIDSTGTKPIPGADGVDPAGVMRLTTPGLVIFGYASKPSFIVLTPQKFSQYLSEEGLVKIAALRTQRNQAGEEAREEFARCAKSLVLSGPAMDGQADRALGFTLELIAERNPYALRSGHELPLRLLYHSKPLEGALVVAINKRNPSARLAARSDKAGRVRFRLAEPGVWLIKSVHMIEAPAGSAAQWASFWASLTFDLPEARPAAAFGQ